MAATIVLDGITVQHAGELIFDTAATARQRGPCVSTYLRSLEDVAFALVFCPSVGVSRNLPNVAGETPGADLCAHFRERIRPFEEDRSTQPGEVLESTEGVAAVINWLDNLAQMRRSDLIFWYDWIARETEAYLWPDDEKLRDKLRKTLRDPREHVFGKDYWSDKIVAVAPELHTQVPDNFVRTLGQRARRLHRTVSSQAAEEFVRRATAAHALIFEWYDQVLATTANPGEAQTHLPHVTRTTFIPEDAMDRQVWRIGRLLMPTLVAQLLRDSDNRREFLMRIEDLIEDSRLDPLRRKIEQALVTRDSDELQKIAVDLESQAVRLGEPAALDFAIKGGFVGLFPKGEVEVRARLKSQRTYQQAIAFVLRRSPDIRSEERALAERVFPELQAKRRDG